MKIVRISKVWITSGSKEKYHYVAYIFDPHWKKVFRVLIEDMVEDSQLKMDTSISSNFNEVKWWGDRDW